MRILVYGDLHHKNKAGLDLVSKKIPVIYLTNLENLENLDDGESLLISGNSIQPINFSKILYGPQIDLEEIINKSNQVTTSIFVNVLSNWIKDICKKFVNNKNCNFLTIPFPVDVEKFKPNKDKINNNFFIYFKHVEYYKLDIIKKITESLENYNSRTFIYGEYQENDYLNYLQTCKFGIWIGSHESQGFALQECLSCDVPLFVLDVKSLKDEFYTPNYYPWRNRKISIDELEATSAPYFDEYCGILIKSYQNIDDEFRNFLENLNNYKPREYILKTLTINQFIDNIKIFLSTPNHTP
jgi:hypothetical protein